MLNKKYREDINLRTIAIADDAGFDFMKYRCEVCGKLNGSKSSLVVHMRSHTGERPYACTFCSVGFTTKGNLQRHLKIVHGSAE